MVPRKLNVDEVTRAEKFAGSAPTAQHETISRIR
jgi:hypothetical protein